MGAPFLTKNQKLVYARLARAGRAMSAYDLLDDLREQGLRAPVQVYRALEKLSEQGLVHRIESLNAFVACASAHHDDRRDGGTAFAICEDCGEVVEFEVPETTAIIDRWADKAHFATQRLTIELRGRCVACADGRPSAG
jgi:Fur family zinc uptake transcriptional regulator